jgi:hypothetical protein
MPAQLHLDGRREPAQAEAVARGMEEGRLGEVHLAGHVLHPVRVARPVEKADRGRVAGEGAVGKGVHLEEV